MRLFVSAAALGLVASLNACASIAAPPSSPADAPAVSDCNAQAADSAIGKPASAEIVEQTRHDAGAKTARVLKPGQMVTMEYREGRLNIHVNERNVITRLTCG